MATCLTDISTEGSQNAGAYHKVGCSLGGRMSEQDKRWTELHTFIYLLVSVSARQGGAEASGNTPWAVPKPVHFMLAVMRDRPVVHAEREQSQD